MKIGVLFEYSGVVRDAFIAGGHNAISCDILPTESPGPHREGDVFSFDWSGFDILICHPPCTYLTLSGNRWLYHPADGNLPTGKRRPHPLHQNRRQQQREAVEFVKKVWALPCGKMCIENPAGVLSSTWMPPTQYIQPYHFGDPAQKKTGLWLRGLTTLQPTNIVEPEIMRKEKYTCPAWMTKTGGKKKTWIEHRWHNGKSSHSRSKTFFGIAAAMADQWGRPDPYYGALWEADK